MASAEQPEPPEGELPLRMFFFALPDNRRGTPDEPPRLTLTDRNILPCTAENDACVMAVNRGGASMGLTVVFTGSYVEREEITFSEVQLEYQFDTRRGTRKILPVALEKRRLPDGTWAYYGELPGFRIPEKIDDRLPFMKQMREEERRGFLLRFTPHGNPRYRRPSRPAPRAGGADRLVRLGGGRLQSSVYRAIQSPSSHPPSSPRALPAAGPGGIRSRLTQIGGIRFLRMPPIDLSDCLLTVS